MFPGPKALPHEEYVQVAEYLIITALFREGSDDEASKAVEWLVNPRRRFQARPFTMASAGSGSQARRKRSRKQR